MFCERIQVINVVLSGGNINDADKALELFAGVELAGQKVLADRAYSSDKIRNYLEEHGATLKAHIIPPNSLLFAKIGEAIKLNRRALNSVKRAFHGKFCTRAGKFSITTFTERL